MYHPSVEKLFNLIQRARPEHATKEAREHLASIQQECDTCQRLGPRPLRFQVSIPDEIIFNRELALDLMYLDGQAVLHIVDLSTRFSSAVFLQDQSTESV
jgi:hypothetical protein